MATVVAPLVGAWIEIMKETKDTLKSQVAPLVGAWIEIWIKFVNCEIDEGRSPRGSVD